MILLSIFITALLVGGFALGIIYIITQTSNETIQELQFEIKDLVLDKEDLESRVNSLCKMLEVQDKLLHEALEPSHQIEVVEPLTVKFESKIPETHSILEVFEAKKPI